MKKALKYTLRILGLLVIFIVLAAIFVPILFKDEIIQAVRRAVDHQIEGAFYFEKAEIGILRTFPHACLELKSPVLTGGFHPKGDSLFSATSLGIVVDVRSLIRKGAPFKVVGLQMSEPRISIFVDSAGHTNYQLVATDTTANDESTSDSLVIEIDDYNIDGGQIRYHDISSDVEIGAKDVYHRGKLRYEGDVVKLRTTTSQGVLSIISSGIGYLDEVQISGRNDLDLDIAQSIYTLLENQIALNALEITAHGSVALKDESTLFDLDFASARSAFKNLISLLPNIYSSDFADLKASGNIALTGSLKGTLSETQVPVYAIDLKVDNGMFQFPGKPLGFSEVNVKGSLHNNNGGWSPVDINLASLRFLLNQQPFDAQIRIQNPASHGAYAGKVKGRIDLADMYNAYPLPQVNAMKGIVNADVVFDFQAGRATADQTANGSLSLQDVGIQASGEDLAIRAGKVEFTPKMVHAFTDASTWNASPLVLDVTARDYIGWLTESALMSVTGSLAMDKFDANRYLDTSQVTIPSASQSSYGESLSNIQFDGVLGAKEFIYDTYLIEDGRAELKGTLKELKVIETQGKINGTTFYATGTLNDIHKYIDGSTPLTGSLDCRMDKVLVDRWIQSTDTVNNSSAGGETGYVALPDDLILDVAFIADEAFYDKIRIQKPRGQLHLENRVLEIYDFKGSSMGGEIVFSGVYNTQDIVHPAFNMKYNLSSLKFSEAFQQIETFQALAPIAKYVQGVFNSGFVFEGKLGKDYFPDLSSLSASGFLETITGSIQHAEILDKVSQFLNLKSPLRWDIGNTKNWFEVKNGYVTLQELTKSIDGVEIGIGGRHQIQGDMGYLIKLNIPADRLATNPVGSLAKAGYEQLQSRASAFGVRLHTIENFIVHVSVRAKLADPKMEITFFDASGKGLKEVAAEQLEDLKQQARDTLSAIAEEKIEEVKDSLQSIIDMAVDSARKAAEEKLKEAGQEILKETTAKLDSTLRDSITNAVLDKLGDKALDNLGQKETDKIKDALDKWDPFKKKKKN